MRHRYDAATVTVPPSRGVSHAGARHDCRHGHRHLGRDDLERVSCRATTAIVITDELGRYAALGQGAIGNVRGTTSVWLACLSARAHSLLGDGEATRTAIQQAEEARATAEPDDLDAFGGIMTFPLPRQLYYVAEATVQLGEDAALGESRSETAVSAYRNATEDEWAFGDQAGAQTDLALARIACGEIEGAAEAVRPVLDLPVEQRNFGIVSSAQRVHAALHGAGRRSSGGAAAGLRQEIEAFTTTPTSALVR
ncbi:hypothetical protein [Streptomyces sp. XY431]|uniref:hypothetical protein n=1 Tax=Streptomyces sp. XY431 TaxID=1415562 RepID=UPI0006AE94FE|nr:hypothetical protein [Streptomyces sp. XY431]